MRSVAWLLPLLLSAPVWATPVQQFSGAFDVSRWVITLQSGSVDTALAPAAVRLVSADDERGPSQQSMTIAAPASGTVSFSWAYLSTDTAPVWDPFGFLLNGTFIPVSDDLGGLVQQGTFSAAVQAGDTFGFTALSFDSSGGAAATTVSAFSFTPASPVPEPATWALAVCAAACGAVLRNVTRQHSKKEPA